MSALLTLAVGVVIVAALFLAREVLIPVTLAVLLSFVLAPLVRVLRSVLPRVAAVLLAVVLALCVVLALGALIGMQVASLADQFPRYQATIAGKLDTIQQVTTERLTQAVSRVGRQLDHAAKPPPTVPSQADGAEKPPLPVEVHQPTPSQFELAERYVAPVLSPLATLGIVFIVAVFILLQQDDLRDRLIRLFGSNDLHRTTRAMDDAAGRLSKYFLMQLAINTVFGCVVAAGLFAIGVPSPVLWGVMAGLMRFLPYIGSPIAAALPLLLAAAVDPGWSMTLWTLALFLVLEPLMGQAVEPLLYGHSTGLSPFSVVVAAIFWTWLWGPIGLILSTPLTLCLVVLGRHVDRLEFLDVLLGDQPALTPVESFYQRMLAGDPDEAIDYAEQLLRERSLSSYYDDVALKGLQLAAHDVRRGVLGPEQVMQLKEAVGSLIADLDEHDDTDPAARDAAPPIIESAVEERAVLGPPMPPADAVAGKTLPTRWQGEAPILCVAGRGSLDEEAAAMLAQLLRKHGLGSRVEPFRGVSRAGIGELDTGGVALVCIMYVEITGTPSHLRYLIRRVRQRFPGLPVLVGLWPSDEAVLRDERLRAAVGAEYYASSLREAVACCVQAARESSELASAEAA